jgi:hypothetical protein
VHGAEWERNLRVLFLRFHAKQVQQRTFCAVLVIGKVGVSQIFFKKMIYDKIRYVTEYQNIFASPLPYTDA